MAPRPRSTGVPDRAEMVTSTPAEVRGDKFADVPAGEAGDCSLICFKTGVG